MLDRNARSTLIVLESGENLTMEQAILMMLIIH